MLFFETLQVEHTLKDFYITIVNTCRINTKISMSAITATGAPHNIMDTGQLTGIPVAECAGKYWERLEKEKTFADCESG